jgi:peptidoglycan/LPS O-acetylase OafA/YrhL
MCIDNKHRIFGLDVIRALAILLVLVSHSSLLLFPNSNGTVLNIVRFFGTIGVDLFFVLSGFLIGNIILKQIKQGKTAFKDFLYFWIRRWFRTLPNYFLILVFNILLFFFLHKEVIDGIGYFFLFWQNFYKPQPDFFTESWSLSIEEYAYVIGPLVLYFLMSFFKNIPKSKLFILTTLIIIFLVAFSRFGFHLNNNVITDHDWSQKLRKVVIFRIDSIYYGFIAAFFSINYSNSWQLYKHWFFITGIVLFFGMHIAVFTYNLLPMNSVLFYNIFYLPLVSISLVMFLPVFSNIKTGKFLRQQITYISILSYAIYLINYSIVLLTIQYFINISEASILIKGGLLFTYWFVTFCLAHFLYVFFEKPMTNLRDSKFIRSIFT